ncbi:MAG: c-type cytochrome [Gammaproteobacteria bacterium]|nr:c-type cytochrome [Gammaproteobacteria bacterium]
MKPFVLAVLLSMALVGCSDQDKPGAKSSAVKSAADIGAGKVIAERDCNVCHRLDGGSAAPAIPILAAQHEAYLFASLKAYKEGKRVHAALKDMTGHMSEADLRNVAAYYASLPPVQSATGSGAQVVSLYERGKAVAEACAKCHGADGNSTTPGTPNLAGQQPRYLLVAIQEYLHSERARAPMHGDLTRMGRTDMESMVLYFASQVPAQRAAPPSGDPAAGEPLSAVCGGCHGPSGVSTDTATPSLASQDPQYLIAAIKSYRTTRKREKMREYVSGLSDKEIENLAAFYTAQKSQPAEKGQEFIKDIAAKCDRCHGAAIATPDLLVPKINGQDRDYLVMALRAYRDDRREVSAMHRMSLPYSDSLIDSLSTYYASQPAK